MSYIIENIKTNPNPILYDKLLKNSSIREWYLSSHEWRGSSPLVMWHVARSMESMYLHHLSL